MSYKSNPSVDSNTLNAASQDFIHPPAGQNLDIDLEAVNEAHLLNEEVKTFAWQGIKVTVKDHKTKEIKAILDDVDGIIEAGELYYVANGMPSADC